jgi:hypothetical protein
MSKEKQIEEVLGWFVVGFIVAALSIVPTPMNDVKWLGPSKTEAHKWESLIKNATRNRDKH